MPTNTPRLGLRRPTGSESAAVPADVVKLTDQLDTLVVAGQQGSTGSTPTTRTARSVYFDQQTKILSWDDGAALIPILPFPVGAVLTWPAAATPPAPGSVQWLELQGQTITRASYGDLFAAWGITDATLVLPNWSGRAPIAAGPATSVTTARTVGDTFGEETHQLSVAELPPHAFGSADTSGGLLATTADSGSQTYAVGPGPGGPGKQGVRITNTNSVGGNQPLNVKQPSIVTRFLVRAR